MAVRSEAWIDRECKRLQERRLVTGEQWPYRECPDCNGDGCEVCGRSGLAEDAFRRAIEELDEINGWPKRRGSKL